MPKSFPKLTDLQVKAKAKVEGRHYVGGTPNLCLLVGGNKRSWILRARIGNRRTDLGLGSYPEVSLSEARQHGDRIRQQIREGVDPVAAKREERAAKAAAMKAKTFKQCVEEFLTSKDAKWENSNAKHVKQWRATLETYAIPIIGNLPIDQVNTDDVLRVLKQDVETKDGIKTLWAGKNETASRLRGRMERILGWATFHELRSGHNPARYKGHLDNELASKSEVRTVKHHASLPYAEIGAFMADLAKREGMSARALQFAILTAARSGEIRNATWGEIDLAKCEWEIPAARMKAKKPHVVPLSKAAVALLEALPGDRKPDAIVFPAARGGAFSDAVFRALFERMGRTDLTQHGFRSTFREWAGEVSKHEREVIEHALAHQLADEAEKAYQRGSLLPKRRALMQDWADYCAIVRKPGDNVVSINQAATA